MTTDQLEQWDICREMCFRTAWKPYMYSQTLPHLLGGVRTPALIIWGDDDQIVPISAGHVYTKALRNARLATIAAMRPLRRDGKARRGRQTRHRLHQRRLKEEPPCI